MPRRSVPHRRLKVTWDDGAMMIQPLPDDDDVAVLFVRSIVGAVSPERRPSSTWEVLPADAV